MWFKKIKSHTIKTLVKPPGVTDFTNTVDVTLCFKCPRLQRLLRISRNDVSRDAQLEVTTREREPRASETRMLDLQLNARLKTTMK